MTGSVQKKRRVAKGFIVKEYGLVVKHTTDIICAKLALAQVVRPNMTINRTGHDPRRSDVERLNGISGLFQSLYRLAILRTGRLAPNVIREGNDDWIRTHRMSHSLTVESYEPNVIAVSIGVTIGKSIESDFTTRHDGGVIIKLYHINFCQVRRYPANGVPGGHIPEEDRSVSARGGELGIVVCAKRKTSREACNVHPIH